MPAKTSHSGYTCYKRHGMLAPSGPGTLQYGVMGNVESIPPGWESSVILSLGTKPGSTVRAWGAKLLKAYGKNREVSESDYISTHLGFDTDNGAFYYYKTEANKTYEETLYDVKTYSDQAGIPYRHLQIDSWWYQKGKDGGTKEWSPGPGVFPDGLYHLFNLTGWVYTAHNRMWSNEAVYAQKNHGSWPWIVPQNGNSLPTSQAFWDWLIASGKQWGLAMYEQDWLYTEFIGVDGLMLKSATLARDWLLQMGRATEANGVTLQLCMAWPRMTLQSLEMQAVTQARASPDYQLKSEQWRIGDNALFIDALGMRPTKDSFRSNQTSGEAYPRLQAAVSTLSAGPVFPSDQIGTSDVALIMRSCDTSGRLLQPDRPAAPTDVSILSKAGLSDAVTGEIWRADVWMSGYHYPQILAANNSEYDLHVNELLEAADELLNTSLIGTEANFTSSNKVVELKDGASMTIPATSKWSFQLWSFAPRLPSGWAILGEALTKWVPVSKARIVSIADDSIQGPTVNLKGPPNENVTMALVAPGGTDILTVVCTLGADENGMSSTAILTVTPKLACRP
jgi:hypothetical protein